MIELGDSPRMYDYYLHNALHQNCSGSISAAFCQAREEGSVAVSCVLRFRGRAPSVENGYEHELLDL